MGFNLELFFERLEYMVSHAAPHMAILEFIKENKEYAQVCGLLE